MRLVSWCHDFGESFQAGIWCCQVCVPRLRYVSTVHLPGRCLLVVGTGSAFSWGASAPTHMEAQGREWLSQRGQGKAASWLEHVSYGSAEWAGHLRALQVLPALDGAVPKGVRGQSRGRPMGHGITQL